MRKRSLLIIISIIVISLVILGLYSTFASSASTGEENVYNITLTDSGSEVSVPAGESKTVIYKITNTNKGTVKYGLAFAGDNIEVKVYDESQDKVTGNIDYGETKFIKLIITNTGTSESTASVKSVMGYKNGGELSGSNIVPSGHTLVTDVYTKPSGGSGGNSGGGPSTLATHITNLYLNNKDTDPVENNGISYGYASIYDKDSDNSTSGGLMNDRHGKMSVGIDEGNVRYYGLNPNNYIYFNCDDYSNQTASTCEIWRIIGVFDGKVKLMRSESIGNLAWDDDYNNDLSSESFNNDWSNSSLMTLLNGAYYNGNDTTYYNYVYSLDFPEDFEVENEVYLFFSYDGIKETTRKLISESIWYLRGFDMNVGYPNELYDYERYSGNVAVTNQPTTLPKKIGIPYVSDYAYSVDFGSCSDNDYRNDGCDNWILTTFNGTAAWFLNAYSGPYSVWVVDSGGDIAYDVVYYDIYGVFPVLHLDSELSIESGDGSWNSPYKLKVS